MAVVDLTKDTFGDFVSESPIGFIDFWAEWCGPCKRFAPIFERVAARNPDLAFGKVDTEDQPELAASFDITSIPTLLAFRDAIVLYAQPGALPEQALDDLVGQIRGLDMDEVRQKVQEAREQAEQGLDPAQRGATER